MNDPDGEAGRLRDLPWGHPEITKFFQNWTLRHLGNGVIRSYLLALNAYADALAPDTSSETVRNTATADLPFIIERTIPEVDEKGDIIAHTVAMERIDPMTGEGISDSLICVGTASMDNASIRRVFPGHFTPEQFEEILAQLAEQDKQGIETD